MKRLFLVVLSIASIFSLHAQSSKMNILVFSKTTGFRHGSIEPGKIALTKMAKDKGAGITLTEDAGMFNELDLKKYTTVIFLCTTGDILNDAQQEAFERYIQAGGGYVGIHSATDTEYDWLWYGKMVGAVFLDHPTSPSNVQKGRFYVTMKNHWATTGMPDEFERMDEFYNFKNISPAIHVVLKLDEKTYQGGKNGDDHPISWYQEFEGGRSFYTAMGHTDESFIEPLFLNHLWSGIYYTSGGDTPKPLDYTRSRPEENRFTKQILEEKLDEPMELSVLNDGRVLFIQRKGEVRIYNTITKQLKTIAKIPVSLKYKNREGKESTAEDGLLGLNKDPNFASNHWIYLYYSAPEASKNILTRYELRGDELVLSSKKILLEIPTQREECCHTGGSIAFDKAGNLYLSTGDNTNPHFSEGYSPSDERPDRGPWDAQKSSSNTNDLRGKIIRIKPTANGSYTIPEGNLFKPGTDLTRPEIYTMGHRNPFRISIDSKTDYLYWGEVGPDAAKPAADRGPEGHDEIGQAKHAGNQGWPHFVGDNKAYYKYDFANKKSLEKWDAANPTNTSPHNTGLQVLPPAQKAFIWYPYAASNEFPLVGSGGRNAMAGPVFHSDDFANAPYAFPNYYDDKLFIYDWMRGWIMTITMDQDGNYRSMERFMPNYKFSNPMDMEFAANGDLYMLEYGTGWFQGNDDARLIRIRYNGGNRKPEIQLSSDKQGGAIPLTWKISSRGTKDADGDALKYSWTISSKNGYYKVFNTPDAEVNLTKAGSYKATLTVTDSKGSSNSQSVKVIAGNEPPLLSFDMPKGSRSFYFANKPFEYEVKVNDKEDGSLDNGKISPERVSVNIDYLPEGYDKVTITQGHRDADVSAEYAVGKKLIAGSDCKSCHSPYKKSIGPSYTLISGKYKGNSGAIEKLTKKVISGGGGVWGQNVMAAHPQLTATDAAEMIKYILNIGPDKPKEKSLPLKGSYTAKVASTDKGHGVYILRAAYKDRGANGLPGISAEQSYTLRNAKVGPHDFDDYKDASKMTFGGNAFVIPRADAYMRLNQIDLNHINAVYISANAPKPQLNAAGGKIEVHADTPGGTLLGASEFLQATDNMSFGGKPLRIPLQPITGLHDLYFVFLNPQADGKSLMIVTGVEFKNELDQPLDQPRVVNEQKTNLNAYNGKYKMTGLPFEYINVTTQNDKLMMEAGGQTGEIKATDTQDKYDADGKATIFFIRDDQQKVVQMRMEAMGFKFEGKKE
jgi:cytochrome c